VREITSLDSKLPDQTEVHIRSDTLAEKNRSHSSRTAATLSMLLKNISHKGTYRRAGENQKQTVLSKKTHKSAQNKPLL